MADKQMFKALVMVELFDSEEEEGTKGRGMTRSWIKKREELRYFTNIVQELQLEDTGGSWISSSVHFFLPFLTVFFVCSTASPLCESIL